MKQNQPRTNEKTAKPLFRRWRMGLIVLMMIGATLVSGMESNPVQAASEETPVTPSRQGRIVMYVMDNASLTLSDEHADKLDQINYSFALLSGGEATGRHWQGIRQMSAFLRRHPQIDGVLSVGGWGADGFSDACATAQGRQKLADSILRLMDEHGFVGVDIDWEYPGSSAAGIKSREEDEENWYALLSLLRAGLDERQAASGRKHLLSVALGAGESQLSRVDGARLGALVDQAVIMAYDLSGFDKTTGHHAGLYPNEDQKNSGAYAVKKLAASGLKHNKMLLGFPAYGRMWRQVSGGGDGLNQRAATSGNKTLTYGELSALEGQGYTAHYDEAAQAAWWFNGSSFVSGESPRSIADKTAWLRKKGLMGAAVWCWNQDASSAMLTELDAGLR